jgi:hypothetical protein
MEITKGIQYCRSVKQRGAGSGSGRIRTRHYGNDRRPCGLGFAGQQRAIRFCLAWRQAISHRTRSADDLAFEQKDESYDLRSETILGLSG